MWTVGQRFCCSFFVPNMRTYLLCAQFRRRGVKVRRLSVGRGALRALSAALSLRSVRRRGAWMCPTIRARGFCRACFFLTAARKTGARRGGFCRRARVLPGVRCFCRTDCGKSGGAVGAAGATLCARRGAKAVSKKRRDRVYAGRGKRRGCGHGGLWGKRRFARPFGGALVPLGSPPGRLALSNYSGAGFLPRLFFSNSRPQIGARRGGFCRRARLYYHLRI